MFTTTYPSLPTNVLENSTGLFKKPQDSGLTNLTHKYLIAEEWLKLWLERNPNWTTENFRILFLIW